MSESFDAKRRKQARDRASRDRPENTRRMNRFGEVMATESGRWCLAYILYQLCEVHIPVYAGDTPAQQAYSNGRRFPGMELERMLEDFQPVLYDEMRKETRKIRAPGAPETPSEQEA